MPTRPYPILTVNEKAARSLRAGHPWVYGAETTGPDQPYQNGDIVDVVSHKGRWLGAGVINDHSKIRVRLLSRNTNDRFDEAFWRRRIQYALDYRKTVMGPDFTCSRLIFGEADHFPGLTVDLFQDILVTEVLSLGMEVRKHLLYPLLVELLKDYGVTVRAIYERNEAALRELARIDLIRELDIVPNQQVSFRFRDLHTRAWLRDVGSVLELYTYKACVDTGIFHDVISSAVVRWDEVLGHGSVSNEIDVMAARGVVPLFLSCKACDIKTEALNELAILRDRFGGKGAKAAIVTTETCNAAARHRAAQLGIAVVDLEELKTGQLLHRLKVIMKVER